MPVGVWTQTLRISWRPSLHYYEGRVQFLRELDASGLVRAFKLSDLDRVEAKIGKSGHELVLTPTSIEIDVLVEDADWAVCDLALGQAVDLSDPSEFRHVSVSYQLIAPLNMPVASAIGAATSAWYGEWTSTIGVTDHAMLVDAEDQKHELSYKAEFGIVTEDEILNRIRRWAGRTRRPPRNLPPDWRASDLPEVAMFMDFHGEVTSSLELPKDRDAWLGELRERTRSVAVNLCETLEESLTKADKEIRKVQI